MPLDGTPRADSGVSSSFARSRSAAAAPVDPARPPFNRVLAQTRQREAERPEEGTHEAAHPKREKAAAKVAEQPTEPSAVVPPVLPLPRDLTPKPVPPKAEPLTETSSEVMDAAASPLTPKGDPHGELLPTKPNLITSLTDTVNKPVAALESLVTPADTTSSAPPETRKIAGPSDAESPCPLPETLPLVTIALGERMADAPQAKPIGEPASPVREVAETIQTQAIHLRALPGGGQATVHLHPSEWGPITVSVTAHAIGAAVTAHILASDPSAKALLESHLGELRQTLHEAGLHLESVTVGIAPTETRQDASFGENRQPPAQSEQFAQSFQQGQDNRPQNPLSRTARLAGTPKSAGAEGRAVAPPTATRGLFDTRA